MMLNEEERSGQITDFKQRGKARWVRKLGAQSDYEISRFLEVSS